MQVGDRFVLNILEEGNHLALMKHFLKRFPPVLIALLESKLNRQPMVHRFLQSSGLPECEVTTRMECSDHWIVYSTVQAGRFPSLTP